MGSIIHSALQILDSTLWTLHHSFPDYYQLLFLRPVSTLLYVGTSVSAPALSLPLPLLLTLFLDLPLLPSPALCSLLHPG